MTDSPQPGTVTVEPFGVDVSVGPGERLLDAILRAGHYVPFGCNHGGCGTCVAPVIAGSVDQDPATLTTLDSQSRGEGRVLLCSSYLQTPQATVDISDSGLTETEFAGTDRIDEFTPIVELRSIATGLTLLRLQRPEICDFQPGQFVQIALPDATGWRSYSIASSPDANSLDVLVRSVPHGRFSDALNHFVPGVQLRIRGPYGTFRIRTSHRAKVLVGGGAGIGPLRPMVLHALEQRDSVPMYLIHTGRSIDELAFHDELTSLAARFTGFTYHPVITGHRQPSVRGAQAATELIDQLDLPMSRAEAYLCGPDRYVDIVAEHLLAQGLRDRYLAADRFTASSGATAGAH